MQQNMKKMSQQQSINKPQNNPYSMKNNNNVHNLNPPGN